MNDLTIQVLIPVVAAFSPLSLAKRSLMMAAQYLVSSSSIISPLPIDIKQRFSISSPGGRKTFLDFEV
jgi:hypothetical protein